jgi:hypothetical protein
VLVGGLDTALLAVALDRQALHTEAGRLLVGFADRQNLDGSFARETHRADAAGAWLWAVGEHVRLSGSPDLAVALVGPIAKAAHHVQRRHTSRRARRVDGRPALLPAGEGPTWLPDDVVTNHDALWSWRGLVGAAFALDAAGQPDAAAEVRRFGEDLGAAIAAHLAGAAAPVGAGPDVVGGPLGPLATAVALAQTLAGIDPWPTGAADALADAVRAVGDDPSLTPAVWHWPGHGGHSPRLTAAAALAEAMAGLPDALARLRWLLDIGAPLWTWPELVHPRTGGGSGGQGHDAAATAAVLDLLRGLVVVETADGLDLLPAVPAEWYGQPIEAHGVPTAWGTLSYAVRWHGERPALLWELVPHREPGVAAALGDRVPVLRAPGLDPGWRSSEAEGEALLAVPPLARPPAPAADEAAPSPADPPRGDGPPLDDGADGSTPSAPDEGASFS